MVIGSFCAFCYKFCEQATTYGSKCLKIFGVSYQTKKNIFFESRKRTQKQAQKDMNEME